MIEFAASLMLWIAAHSDLKVPAQPPDIRIVSSAFMNKQLRPAEDNTINVSAYNYIDDYIMLLKYEPANKNQVAALVHELVHYMQWKSSNRNDYNLCPGSSEVLAYGIEAKWRRHTGMEVWWTAEQLEVMARC